MLMLWTMLACAPEGEGQADVGCVGLDMDGDGVCDREAADWSEDASVPPGEDRSNIYQLSEDDLLAAREAGLGHMFTWPVTSTRMLLPYRPLQDVLTDPDDAAIRNALEALAGFSSEDGLYDRMGLSRFAEEDGAPGSPYWAPPPDGMGPGDPMGVTIMQTDRGEGLTFSCATCHVDTMFGRPVVGLTSKRPRPNALFHFAGTALSQLEPDAFQDLSGATDGEVEMFTELVDALASVGTMEPVALGLDTSLAQVGLSLARRTPDEIASFDPALQSNPAPIALDTLVADSKPMVWWTLKYKTRWLADGSIVSGNPVFTNFLWNELGRGADLETLADWMATPEGALAIDELTVAVFASEAPRWTDFFGADTIDEALAQEGQALFAERCATCHGTYEKGWDADDADSRDAVQRLETTRVAYHAQTPRVDVGTDPQRAEGMADLEALNALAISKMMETTVRAEPSGYVPPPLDGIWARYPYLHHNAAPTLCDLLSPPEARTTTYVQGPAEDPDTDFDMDCVGYPTADAIPDDWIEDEEAWVTLGGPGQTLDGHDEMLYDADGTLAVGDAERAALIEFLKTL